MRLLTIATDPNAGGSSISLLNLLNGLKIKGYEIVVIIPRKGFLSEHLQLINIQYITVPHLRYSIWPPMASLIDKVLFLPRLLSYRFHEFISRRDIKRIVSEFKPDIIHSNVSLFSTGLLVAKKLGIPHVWHIREYGYLDFGLYFYPSKKQRLKLLNDGYSVAITNGLKDYFKLNNKCQVIYNGIKSKDDIAYSSEKKDFYLFVGHVNPNKGVTDLINAFIKYRDEGGKLKLILAGRYDNVYKTKLISLLNKKGYNDYVDFKGQFNDIDKLMQNAKAIIVPSKYEGFGRVAAEAMFNGCLVIGRFTGGIKEQLELGETIMGNNIGYSFTNIIELKNTMLKIDGIPQDVIEKVILRAQKFAKEHFSIQANVELTFNFLNKINNISKQ